MVLTCSACTALYSVGAPRCPHCGSTPDGAGQAPIPEPDVADAALDDDEEGEDEADG